MYKKLFLFACILSFTCSGIFAQNKTMNTFEQQWRTVDSLMDKGLPKSALKIALQILKEAETKNDAANKIKAQLFLLTGDASSENSDNANITKAEQYISQTSGAEKALWQSITGEMYWNYYQNNRYKLLSRTALSETNSTDINTWDAPAFFEKIAQLYKASLENRVALQQIPVEQFAPLIVKGVNTRNLRPTIYDLLVFRALEFFQNDEKDVTNAAYKFELGGMPWFETAEKFSTVKVKVKDANSLHFQALQLYQEVIAFHLKDAQPDALIDADLQRLAFIHQNSVSPDKDSLYLNALKNIEQKYAAFPAVAEVSFLIAEQQLGNVQTSYYGRGQVSISKENADRDIPRIAKYLEKIIAKYPKTEGAIHARNLLQNLQEKSLQVKTEEVNIPDENIKALITYKNTEKIYLKVYRLSNEIKENKNENSDERLKAIQKMSPLKSWEQQLPGSADMEQHTAEIKIDALPIGAYLLVTSLNENLTSAENLVIVTEFQVSNLSFIAQSEGNKQQFYVLNRKSGQPVAKAKLSYWTNQYNESARKNVMKENGNATSNEKGEVNTLPNQTKGAYYGTGAVLIIHGQDSLNLGNIYGNYSNNTEKKQDQNYTFLFTDRSIYRPGQTVYFKGIMVKKFADNQKTEVIANAKTTAIFYDANGQKVDSLDLITNEFGSFTGNFIAPETGLTSQMSIRGDKGQVYFSIEEYKRPNFFVEYDTLKGSYALNQNIQVKGFAKAYAGNNIDGATVNYRVVRRARFPYYWAFYRWGMPNSPEMEITNGTTTTKEDGSFELNFETIPDRSIDPKTLPVFTYTVYADITDINGETRSGNQMIQAGYVSLQILAQIPEESKAEDLDTIFVSTQNLNNIFVPSNIQMTIAPLQFPGKIYRERLWEEPDQFVMSETEFRSAFPDDEYKEESDYRNWEIGKIVYEQDFMTKEDRKIAIPKSIWKNAGWYVFEFKGKDAQGNEVLEKKYTFVSIPEKNKLAQKPLIVRSSKDVYEPGEKAQIALDFGFKDVYLLENNSFDKSARSYQTSNPQKIFDKTITEADRGGIGFSWLFVYNNRVYTANKNLDIPWSNKELQLEWATHRDKLLPGASEEWSLTIKGNKKEKVAAELLAGMYDASLDAFKPHAWSWDRLTSSMSFYNTWNQYGFDANGSEVLKALQNGTYKSYEKSYDRLGIPGFNVYDERRIMYMSSVTSSQNKEVSESSKSMDVHLAAPSPLQQKQNSSMKFTPPVLKNNEDIKENTKPEIQVRKNLQETAFFFPQLQTDAEGNVKFKFTIPEALTEWKMMAFAHTKDWKTGYLEGKVKTQKDLMVIPNLPRFLRQGDQIEISTKINNLSDKDLNGTANIEILDAQTMQPVHLSFGLKELSAQQFSVSKAQSTTAKWTLSIPQSRYSPVIIRITAKAGNFSDGEENTLPVITNRMLVTETLPLPIRGNGTKNFSFDKLINQNSNTLLNRSLTVEFTGNPAWYAVQALPYLMEYPYECAEQTFNRFYANALAAHIVAQSPKVEQIFNQWKTQDTAALLSNLEKNQELKSALLEETPWVMDAKNESEQKQRIAGLFEAHQIAKGLTKNLATLEQMQLPAGSFPWFNGMRADRFITQYIITGIGKLQHLGVENSDYKKAQNIVTKALPYLDEQLKQDYDKLVKNKADLSKQQIGNTQIQYLYMRSFFKNQTIPTASKKAFDFYQKQAGLYWNSFNPYMKGMIALALNRLEDKKTPNQIIASLKETAIENEEMGMYWKNASRGYWWYQAPIEEQALLIEAFSEITKDGKTVDDLKTWLLKQKQTQNWKTTKATADAVYALLLQGNDWLSNNPEVTIQLGNKTITSTEIKTEAGTGYFKEKIEGKDVQPEMGNISVKIDQVKNEGVSWGAVYWQYFEDMDKITSAETPLSLKKQLFVERNSDKGPVLTEIKDGNELKVGDKVKVRIILQVDRDMEYVHMKDMRAACFEPVNVLTGYKYQGGLGYYENTKDVSTNFFFDYLRKGTFVFEYPVFVGQKGDFSNGISTIQCMYAPEFSSHSEGIRVRVK